MDNAPTMDEWTQKERTKTCPFNYCMDRCPIKTDRCEIENILRNDHKTNVNIFDVKTRW